MEMFPQSLECVKFTSDVSSSRRRKERTQGGGKTPVEGGGDSLVFIIHFLHFQSRDGSGTIHLQHRNKQTEM